MTTSSMIPECLNSFEPVARIYVDGGALDDATNYSQRYRVNPTLAGYALSPGRSYRVVVKVANLPHGQWKLKGGPRPYMVSDFREGGTGPGQDERYISFDAEKSAGSWWHSLVRYGDDLRLRIEFTPDDYPPRELRVPVTLNFPKLGWFVAAIPSLAPALVNLFSEEFMKQVRAWIGFEIPWWLRTFLLPSLFLLLVAWKWVAMPWIRARQVLIQTRKRLLEVPEQKH